MNIKHMPDLVMQNSFFNFKLEEGSVKLQGNCLVGSTYEVKDFIKAEFNARWNKDSKGWELTPANIEKFNKFYC